MEDLRHDWTIEELKEIYEKPLLELIYEAATVHRTYWNSREVQMSTLLSIKTGGCVEDCAYCPQAARYHTDVKVHKLLPVETVLDAQNKPRKRVLPVFAWVLPGEKCAIIATSTKCSTW